MITYIDTYCGIGLLFRRSGSVFASASLLALGPALLTVILRVGTIYLFPEVQDTFPSESLSRLYNTFTWVFGFVLVFRTGVAYNRYWDGQNLLKVMTTEWYDACAQITCFAETSINQGADPASVHSFQNGLVRLFSLLHCLALQHIAEMEDESFEVIDLSGMDPEPLHGLNVIHDPMDKATVVFQWIQRLTLEAANAKIIQTPPPILSRSFQEMNAGMVALSQMSAITFTPFPFPYAQMIGAALVIHWLLTPLLFGTWLEVHIVWSGIFAFISVFALCALNLIAVEIEQPFGDDPNDLDVAGAQNELNRSLLLLLRSSTQTLIGFTPPQRLSSASGKVTMTEAQMNFGSERFGVMREKTKRLSQTLPGAISTGSSDDLGADGSKAKGIQSLSLFRHRQSKFQKNTAQFRTSRTMSINSDAGWHEVELKQKKMSLGARASLIDAKSTEDAPHPPSTIPGSLDDSNSSTANDTVIRRPANDKALKKSVSIAGQTSECSNSQTSDDGKQLKQPTARIEDPANLPTQHDDEGRADPKESNTPTVALDGAKMDLTPLIQALTDSQQRSEKQRRTGLELLSGLQKAMSELLKLAKGKCESSTPHMLLQSLDGPGEELTNDDLNKLEHSLLH